MLRRSFLLCVLMLALLASTFTVASASPGAPPRGAPSVPIIAAVHAGNRQVTLSWEPSRRGGMSRLIGYRVTRSGTDLAGRGPTSTTVGANTRAFTARLLRNGTRYTFTVAAINRQGISRRVARVVTPIRTRPVVVQSAIGRPVTLRQGGPAGPRLRMAGVIVWGVPDTITTVGGFAQKQYSQRFAIAAAAKAWGANHIRLRLLADDYNHDRQGLSKARRLAMVRGWRDATVAAGLYLQVTWWDSLDGYAKAANWPSRFRTAFPMMTDVYRTLGNDDSVMYEPFNEPNSFSDPWNAWGVAMRATLSHWRGLGYTGVLVMDTPRWSHEYDDAAMTALEQYDAGLPGMHRKHQLVFAKHDYANEGWPDHGYTFDPAKWRADTGGSQRHHLIWESEYGNSNGNPPVVRLSWSQQASTFFANEFADRTRPNYVGATAFVWGPRLDRNALTDARNNPTAWGRAVRDNLLRRSAATWP